jgi:hypothetical protein
MRAFHTLTAMPQSVPDKVRACGGIRLDQFR